MKRPVFVIIFISLIIVILSIVQVSVANQISTTGSELVALQNKVNDYQRENTILHEQLLAAASFTTIADKAKQLGYVPAKSQVYLNTPLPLALKQ